MTSKTHCGWTITQGRWPEPEWTAISPNYDASYEGEEDGWVDNGERVTAATLETLLAEIDAWFEDNAASVDTHPKGGDALVAPSRSDDSAGRNGIAQ